MEMIIIDKNFNLINDKIKDKYESINNLISTEKYNGIITKEMISYDLKALNLETGLIAEFGLDIFKEDCLTQDNFLSRYENLLQINTDKNEKNHNHNFSNSNQNNEINSNNTKEIIIFDQNSKSKYQIENSYKKHRFSNNDNPIVCNFEETLIKPSNFSLSPKIKENNKPMFNIKRNFKDMLNKQENTQKKYSSITNFLIPNSKSKEEIIFPINRKPKDELNKERFCNRNQMERPKVSKFSILDSVFNNTHETIIKKKLTKVFESIIPKNEFSRFSKLCPEKKYYEYSNDDFFSNLYKKLENENKSFNILNKKIEKVSKYPNKTDEKLILSFLNKNERKIEKDVADKLKNKVNFLTNHNQSKISKESPYEISNSYKKELNKFQLKHQFNDTDPISVVIQKNLQEFKNHFSQNHIANTDKNFKELENKLDELNKKKNSKNPYKLNKTDILMNRKTLDFHNNTNNEINDSDKINLNELRKITVKTEEKTDVQENKSVLCINKEDNEKFDQEFKAKNKINDTNKKSNRDKISKSEIDKIENDFNNYINEDITNKSINLEKKISDESKQIIEENQIKEQQASIYEIKKSYEIKSPGKSSKKEEINMPKKIINTKEEILQKKDSIEIFQIKTQEGRNFNSDEIKIVNDEINNSEITNRSKKDNNVNKIDLLTSPKNLKNDNQSNNSPLKVEDFQNSKLKYKKPIFSNLKDERPTKLENDEKNQIKFLENSKTETYTPGKDLSVLQEKKYIKENYNDDNII